MDLERTTAPTETPVSLDTVKAHLRISHSFEDANLTRLIGVATEFLDGRFGHLRRALVTQAWTLTLPWWPYTRCVPLPLPPLQSVASVQYFDGSNVLQTLDPSQYAVVKNDYIGRVEATPLSTWPTTFDRRDAVRINFVAGYGDADAVPAPIKHALLLMLGDLFVNRGDNVGTLSETQKRLLAQYRVEEFS